MGLFTDLLFSCLQNHDNIALKVRKNTLIETF